MLLGSGELGKEFVIACKRKGQYVVACDKYAGAPAMQVADECRVFSMLDGDALMAAVEEVKPDIIVPEIEAIRTEKLYDCERMGIQVVPSARAVNYTMNRKSIRELAHTELGLKTARYRYANTYQELVEAAREIGFPCIIKPLMSSSGHGQSKADRPEDLPASWECACGGARGDLVITTKVEEHPLFKRDGADVRMELPVSMYEAALGATVDVPTPDGATCRLKIPAGTQDGKTFRFRDLGAPNVKRKGSKGALYVKVRIKVPTRLSAKEREALEALQAADEREYRKDVEAYGA